MAKEISLTRKKIAIVDDEDYEKLSVFNWHAYPHRNTFYARRNMPKEDGRQTQIHMHSFIISPDVGYQVDHINGNGLDNRRKNLRICTHAENMQNRRLHKNNTSGYKGVYFTKPNKWRALISVNNKLINLGLYEEIEDAARAYDLAAMENYGIFANTNF